MHCVHSWQWAHWDRTRVDIPLIRNTNLVIMISREGTLWLGVNSIFECLSFCFRVPAGPVALHTLTQGDPLRGGRTLALFPGKKFGIAPTCIYIVHHSTTYIPVTFSCLLSLSEQLWQIALLLLCCKVPLGSSQLTPSCSCTCSQRRSELMCIVRSTTCLHRLSKYFLFRANRTSVK